MKNINSLLFSALLIINFNLYSNLQATETEPTWETMKYGLFVHFVYGGEYKDMTPLNNEGNFPQDIDEFAEKFNVQKFTNDVDEMPIWEYYIPVKLWPNINFISMITTLRNAIY